MYLLRAAKIIDSESPFNEQVRDILIDDGNIVQIGENLNIDNATVLSGDNWHVSSGWVDMRVQTHDPGHEHKEDLSSVCAAAMAGGFTEIAVLPNTSPALDSKDTLTYIRAKTQQELVKVHAIGAITKQCAGKDFTEMIDLSQAGAVAFSDGIHALHNTHIFLKSLQYLQQVDKVLMNRPEDLDLTIFGQMHEGIASTQLGMRGIPSVAEELMLERDLKLLEYIGTQSETTVLHFSTISTAAAVRLIRHAKERDLPISCDVAAHQIAFTDNILESFDTNYKVNPPFRTEADVAALWAGLADGTIDAVVSDHTPQDEESKNVEFDMAEFGIIGLETAFAVINTHNKILTLNQLIDKFTKNPRQILRLPTHTIEEGAVANLTIFDPTLKWNFTQTHSKSKNSPFFGQTFSGKALFVFNQGKMQAC